MAKASSAWLFIVGSVWSGQASRAAAALIWRLWEHDLVMAAPGMRITA